MKRSYLWSLLLSGVFVTGLILFSCTKDMQETPVTEQSTILTVQQAREFFETQGFVPATRSSGSNDEGVVPGDFTPLWNEAEGIMYRKTSSVIVPIVSAYKYAAAVLSEMEDVDGNRIQTFLPVMTTQALVVVKEKNSDKIANYIVTLVPANARITENEIYRRFVDNQSEGKFNGTAMYSLLSGEVICVDVYKNGICTDEAFIDTNQPDNTVSIEQAKNLISNLVFVRYAQTRLGAIDIDPIVVIGGGGGGGDTDDGSTVPPIIGGGGDGGGVVNPGTGGDGGGQTPPPETKPVAEYAKKLFNEDSNLTEEQWELVEKMVKRIMDDCMGSTLYNQIMDKNLNLVYNPDDLNSYYDPNSQTITLSSLTHFPVLTQELFHVYQYDKYASKGIWNTIEGNIEVEAHTAEMLLATRANVPVKLSEYRNKYTEAIASITWYIDKKSNIRDQEMVEYYYREAMRIHKEKVPEILYSSTTHMNLENLRELSKDC